ncbi:MAG TPA: GAF domain-containing SpoIIE family protein phosphatase, partial [Chloroflexia bacterium]|nr:GAF domain-containing SpoIIE family protein phosphatase [Chloroflexia bacterium]
DLLSAGRTTLQVPDGWVRAAIARPEALDLDLPGVSTRVAAVWELLHNEGVGVVLPLVTGGDLVGVLLLGRKRDQAGFLREELDVLEAIAGQAALALRNAQLLVGRAEQERLRSELDIARTIQRNLLPARLPDLPGLEIAAACLPAQETSGDSYDLVVDEHGTLHVLVADACGKSIPAAMLIALSRNTLRGALRRTAAPGRALSETNEILLPDLTRSQFLAVSCASIDPQAREVRLANAGQMYPLLARPGRNGTPSTCDFLETPFPRLPLGLMGNLVYQETCTPLHPGDVLVCYSDGLVDVAQRTGEQFGFDRLVALLGVAAQEGHGAEEILATLLAAAGTWGEQDTPQDDITLVVVRVCAHEGPR